MLRTIAEGQWAGAVEDIALIDLNADGYLDVVGACEDAHLLYLQNPGEQARNGNWSALIPEFSKGRGSWLRVFATDIDGDGRTELTAANKGTADVVRLDAVMQTMAQPLSSGLWVTRFNRRAGARPCFIKRACPIRLYRSTSIVTVIWM